jgi:hypothetical protein
MPLVEFKRYDREGGQERFIRVNPQFISWVIPSISDNHCILRGPDGRGFDVVGSYEEVMRKLEHPAPQLVN